MDFFKAFPYRWKISSFDVKDNGYAIEIMESLQKFQQYVPKAVLPLVATAGMGPVNDGWVTSGGRVPGR